MALGLGSDFRFDIHARDRTGPAWRGVETSMQRTARAGRGLMAALGPLLGVGGVALGGTMLASMARTSLDFSENLVLAADRTSFTVDELERLRFAGRQVGVEIGQTDMAMQRWSRRVAEAANGTGELQGDLEKLNIPLRDSQGNMRSSYDILLDYATAVENAGSSQEQLRLSFKAFDSEGAALVNMLREGRDGLEEFAHAAEDAGAIIGDELARNAAEAARTMREMEDTIGAEFNRSVAENADELANLAEALGDIASLAIKAGGALGSMWTFVRDDLAESPLENLIGQMQLERRLLESAIEREQSRVDEFTYLPNTPANDRRADRAQAELNELRGQQAMLDERIERLTMRLQQEQSRRDTAAQNRENSDAGSGAGGSRPLDMPDDDWGADVTPGFAGRPTRAALRADAKREAMEGFAEIAREQAAALKDAELEALRDRRDAFSHEFAATFASGVMAAVDGDLAEFLRRRLYQAAYDGLYEAFNRAGEHLFDLMSQSGGGEGGGSGFLSTAATVLTAAFGGGRASGGPMQAGMMYRVGETGPETIISGVPATVLAGAGGMPGREVIRDRLVFVSVDKSDLFDTAVQEAATPVAERAAGQAYAAGEARAQRRAARNTKRLR
ncbi:MAG: hypothetical protein ACJA0Y_000189 [Maricaulis maris]|jgi:hypothetical protein